MAAGTLPPVRRAPPGPPRTPRHGPEAQPEETHMAWTAPIIEEVACGMEINMYFPADEDDTLF